MIKSIRILVCCVLLILFVFLTSCEATNKSATETDGIDISSNIGDTTLLEDRETTNDGERDFYTVDDFDFLKVGVTTELEVYSKYPPKEARAHAEGSILKYPMEDGKYIKLFFMGPEMIFHSMTVEES